jgi:hypothetical protein
MIFRRMIINKKRILSIWIIAFFPMLISFAPPQEARVNQKKIERERAKKGKEAKRQYDKAVKQHHNMQSKTTKARMKQTKKESKSATPIKR